MNKASVISLLGIGALAVVATAGAIAVLLYGTTCRMCRSW
jgi:hypothetical protein